MSNKGDEVVEKKVKRSTLTRRKQRAFGDSLRDWLQDRAIAAEKRSKDEAEERKSKPRGVDRVPEHLKKKSSPRPESSGMDDNYFLRRSMAKRFGTRDERGNFTKAPLRRGSNRPYINPERKQRSR